MDIFQSRYGTEVLPPHQPYNLRITLQEGAKLKLSPLFEMSPDQIKEILDREKAAGRIKAITLPYGSPTFLVDKKDSRY